MLQGKSVEELVVGEKASFTKTISEADVYMFAGITGDLNPAHVNEEYAKGTIFKERIAHGILSTGLISAVLGMQLPGPGNIYISQTVKFTAPVKIGDTITAEVEVLEINVEKNRVKLRTTCTNQNGQIVIDGEAISMPVKKNK
ncbi:enoyl-CoA hydratase [Thermanaerosceptrum fracticalcis]|jgi:3-hydroxybutyryl-CoA dehydratase|uniref:Enoyl-CoA hydratase n=1 Tax=Thermanaerosceptrum fracticalcis TaxID=1712410 RepID=A0A7G6E3S8_THEFR|nr:MaoC family dehydratase [Thermanaerosceptrum fracticalcis]QNB46732.1 enoyl-CoA hydratase [Thermanaerosceptrum fracticalcis]